MRVPLLALRLQVRVPPQLPQALPKLVTATDGLADV